VNVRASRQDSAFPVLTDTLHDLVTDRSNKDGGRNLMVWVIVLQGSEAVIVSRDPRPLKVIQNRLSYISMLNQLQLVNVDKGKALRVLARILGVNMFNHCQCFVTVEVVMIGHLAVRLEDLECLEKLSVIAFKAEFERALILGPNADVCRVFHVV